MTCPKCGVELPKRAEVLTVWTDRGRVEFIPCHCADSAEQIVIPPTLERSVISTMKRLEAAELDRSCLMCPRRTMPAVAPHEREP